MDFSNNNSLFGNQVTIPDSAEVVWVSDMFVEDYVGGAELTSDALIKSSPFEVFKLHSKDVSMELLQQGHEKFWIFSNISALDMRLIPTIVANMRYDVVCYDYFFCTWRSVEKHSEGEGAACNCHNEMHGKLVSTLYHQARSLWWMSEEQMKRWHDVFPFLADNKNIVLSSVFSPETLAMIKILRNKYKNAEKTKHIVLGSPSWIKGTKDAESYCKKRNLDYEVVWGLPYGELLEKLAQSRGLVFTPRGADTCPRICIEQALLGGEVLVNECVQNHNEEWCKDLFTLI